MTNKIQEAAPLPLLGPLAREHEQRCSNTKKKTQYEETEKVRTTEIKSKPLPPIIIKKKTIRPQNICK